ncbi:MAG TPA: class I SAM-dependent methyltransferase [Kofleriaceae bacterium]|nr:class I SAM-dependent methyltransferase [Kofleriaceae bacterium]
MRVVVRLAVAALIAAALAACKAEPDKAAAGHVAEADRDGDDDQTLFDRERQPEVIIKALALEPGMVVADVGAGTGLLTVHVARAVSPGGRVVATDIDGAVLEYLRSRMIAAGYDHSVEGRVVTPTEPGLEDGRYDAILLAQVDHYFDDRVGWLTKVRPALAPGGKLAIVNRMHHRSASLAAADAAGFQLVTEISDIPGQYVAVFQAKASAPTPPPPPATKASP